MENVKPINSELAVAMGQVTPEQLKQANESGFKSVLNLRSPNEDGFLKDEQQQAEKAGLKYVNVPVKSAEMSEELADQVLQQIDQLPKPALIHCKSGLRSGVMSLMYVATQEGLTADEALAIAEENDFDCDAHPQMKQFFKQYVSEHQKVS